jgi:hypothetical protein
MVTIVTRLPKKNILEIAQYFRVTHFRPRTYLNTCANERVREKIYKVTCNVIAGRLIVKIVAATKRSDHWCVQLRFVVPDVLKITLLPIALDFKEIPDIW